MFRKSPAIMKNWEQYGVDYYNKLQKEIITFAARMLKPGGLMLYSTCTFSPEEDEGTISYLLEKFPEFQVINAIPDQEVQEKLGISYDGFDFGRPEWGNGRQELKHCIRLWPHKIHGEGHFIALLRKGDTEPFAEQDSFVSLDFHGDRLPKTAMGTGRSGKHGLTKSKTMLSEEAQAFIKDINRNLTEQEEFVVRDSWIYLTPEGLPDIKRLRILRQGLLIGEMKKQRFEPAQALANALNVDAYQKTILLKGDDPNVIRYLKCETIELNKKYEDGWYLVCVDNYPLGWSKITKNNFKNKYLPGWRWV